VVDRFGTYVAQLIVNDGTVNSLPGTVTISTLNSAPVANAGPDQTVFVFTVTLDGSASSDVDGDPLTYSWTFISRPAGSTATLSGANTVSPSLTADPLGGVYVVQLIVNDGKENSAPDTVTITVSPLT
jgi:hypothetical protein